MKVLVAGASGFVGRRLCAALVDAGHTVRAMTRHPDTYSGGGDAVPGEVHDGDSLVAAMAGCEVGYYLVHSLGEADFEQRDADAARTFAHAAARAGLTRIVYLGGLGSDTDNLSAHLRSRRHVEKLLGCAGVPVTTLRAGIIVGRGGISWEMTRQLVEHLPAMVTPQWVRTRTQPIAIADVVRYLVGVLDVAESIGRAFDIGGPEVLAYVDMMRRLAVIEGRQMLVVPVPLLTPRLSSRWLSLVTDVDTQTGRSLIDSMSNEVIVRDDSIRQLVPFEPMSYDNAVLAALGERAIAARASAAGWQPPVPAARYGFAWRSPFTTFLRLIGIRENSSGVWIGDGILEARFGHWRVRTPLANVASVEVSGPYKPLRAVGVRLSLADYGLTFGSGPDRGVCIQFHNPVPGILPGGRPRHPSLTVTVEHPVELAAAMRTLADIRSTPAG